MKNCQKEEKQKQFLLCVSDGTAALQHERKNSESKNRKNTWKSIHNTLFVLSSSFNFFSPRVFFSFITFLDAHWL